MRKIITVTLLVTAMFITTAQLQNANAAPASDKVEICHRTHIVADFQSEKQLLIFLLHQQ